MIKYPFLEVGATIGVTAPSSGVPTELHELLRTACMRMEQQGYKIYCGETVWSQDKAKSAPAKTRAEEFNQMITNQDIHIIIPPWGGELLIETLEFINFDNMQNKWVLGYSDISLLLLAITLKTGIATAHGTNLIDLRGAYSDDVTAMWQSVLSLKKGQSISQHSSEKYQKEWLFDNPSPYVFHFTEKTEWKSTSSNQVNIQGRLLGGCIDTIRHLIGTTFGNIQYFNETFIKGDAVLWFFENCDLTTPDLRRTLVQMKLAGWFTNCSGIMFGRSGAGMPVENYTIEDVYHELSTELQIPIIYDIDCGHLPPQMTLINGAYAEVQLLHGKGTIVQHFI
ncbi:S66 peptidase family protein [Lysinibacillus sp. 38-6]|uniref:S66 family peptidase n=1 Tax=Lysinibacillus sp. 38-6 TaxID=3385991 RepID=UPI003908ACAE